MTGCIVITGASRGLGEHACLRLLAAGHTVVAVSRSRPMVLEETAERAGNSERLTVLLRDLSDPVVASTLIHDIEVIAPCVALLNNAAVSHAGLTATLSEREVTEMINLNLVTPILLSRLAGMYMMRRRGGCIINVSSVAASSALNGLAVYGATKAGLEQFSRALARELGPRGVRVNCVAPGFLDTAMSASLDDARRQSIRRRTPLNGGIGLDDACAAIEFLLSNEAKAVTGQVITVDGGFSL